MTAADLVAAAHYDRVTAAWRHLLGEELHHGLFATGAEDLATATRALTDRMVAACRLEPGAEVLDVGCGTGASACVLAAEHGARVVGITTSAVGVDAGNERAARQGLTGRARFELRDGMANGLPDASFDRVWVLESSHLMPARDRLLRECARVLRPGGRLALCDIVRRREIPILEVRAKLRELTVLHAAFGTARMESLDAYRDLAGRAGLVVDEEADLTAATRPTFDRWRANAEVHRDAVVELVGEAGHAAFVESTRVLSGLWDDGTLGYGLLGATKPA